MKIPGTNTTTSSFGFRIFRLSLVLVFLIGVTLSTLFVREQNREAEIALNRRGATLVRSLASASEVGAFGGGRAALEPAMRGSLSDQDVQYAVVYDAKGRSIGSLTPDYSLLPPEGSGQIPEPDLAVLLQSTGIAGDWDDTDKPALFVPSTVQRLPSDDYPVAGVDYFFPIIITRDTALDEAALLGEDAPQESKRELIGLARVGLTRASLVAARERSLAISTLTLAISLLLATFASLELSRRLAAPLRHLAATARVFGEGKLAERAPVETKDEVGELAIAFNRMAGNLQDVYQRLEDKVAERTRELAEEKHRLEAVLNTVDEGVILVDGSGRYVMANRRYLELFDLKAQQVIGRKTEDLLADLRDRIADFPKLAERTRLLNTSQREERSVDVIELTAPERRIIHRFSAPVRDMDSASADGGSSTTDKLKAPMVGRIAVFRDITRETEIDRMKSEFISTVSHELRTPLTSIKGSLGLIMGGAAGPIPEDANDLLAIAANNSDRLIRLINDILDISKIESGKMKLKLSDFDLVDVVTEAMQGIDAFGQKHGVKVARDVREPAMMVSADRDRILQVLTNLLSNAIKFSPKGSTVTLQTTRDHRGMWRMSIIDTGPGIPKDQIGKLFQKFQQVDGTFSNQVGGTGLGLAICRALVHEHGGEIWVESEVDKGSTFAFTLPAPEVTASHTVAEVLAATGTIDGTPRVLVVDDDRDVANLIRMYLEREGFECVVAIGGAVALEQARASKFDAVTLDLNMPGISGLEVAKQLKESPATKDVPIIFVSVSAAEETAAAGFGFADWITKPIDPMRLVGAVKRHAAKRQGKPWILVVDDDPDIQKLMGIILSREGFDIESASNGEEALRRVASRRPDLIVLDLVMPAMDGFAVVERLRENRATRRIPILVLTVKDLSDDEREMLQTGATKFLTKSYANRDALLREVVDLLNGALRSVPEPPTGERVALSPEVLTSETEALSGRKPS